MRTMRTKMNTGGTAAPGAGTTATLGGIRQAVSRPGRSTLQLGDEAYLWILVLLEVGAIAWLRSAFSRYHGG